MFFFWELFGDAPHVVQILSLIQMAFTIWMMVDAYQRHAEQFWYWVIFFFQPIGSWVYFFAIKVRTLRLPGMRPGVNWERKLSLDELRYRVERAPTVANRLAFAERLMEKSIHADAIPYLEAVLAIEPDYCAALHDLAECRHATGAAEQAIILLEKLIHRDYRWSNYRAFRTLIAVRLTLGRSADALKACRELRNHQPSLENKCLLAEHLLENGIPAEAVQLLDQALEDHHYSSWSARWKNWRWAREARRLLAEAESVEDASEATS